MNNLRLIPKILVFSAVAKKRSFTKAAEYLGVSKSAVSQQVSQLEADLGMSLINRTTRGISLTAIGEKISEKCESLQYHVDSIFEDIDNVQNNPSGRFTITFPHSLEFIVIAPAIEQLCREFPGLEPTLIASDETIDLVDHNIDIAIHAGELPDSSYRALPIGTMYEIFCASPGYLATHTTPTTLSQLQTHNWIATNWQNKNMLISNVDSYDTSKISLNEFARVNALPTAIDMALRDMGIVLLPHLAAQKLIQNGSLVQLIDTIIGPRWPVYALHAYQNKKPVYATRFYELVCHFFQGLSHAKNDTYKSNAHS